MYLYDIVYFYKYIKYTCTRPKVPTMTSTEKNADENIESHHTRFSVQCDTVYFIALKDNIFYGAVIKLENACNTQLNLHKYII